MVLGGSRRAFPSPPSWQARSCVTTWKACVRLLNKGPCRSAGLMYGRILAGPLFPLQSACLSFVVILRARLHGLSRSLGLAKSRSWAFVVCSLTSAQPLPFSKGGLRQFFFGSNFCSAGLVAVHRPCFFSVALAVRQGIGGGSLVSQPLGKEVWSREFKGLFSFSIRTAIRQRLWRRLRAFYKHSSFDKEFEHRGIGAGSSVSLATSWSLVLGTRMNTLNMSMNMMNTLNLGMNLLNMFESSDKESHDPPAFGGEDTESEEPSQYVCSEDESSQTEGVVEGMIESRMVVHEGERGEPSIDSQEVEYREMHRNYRVLEAVADRVLALPHTPEVGSSNQASPLGSVGVDMASASEGVDIGLVLPFHPWVQMMLAKLRYASWQYNPKFWILLHGVYIAWWIGEVGADLQGARRQG
ncbi:unnamed protein product [Prunus brigantina]